MDFAAKLAESGLTSQDGKKLGFVQYTKEQCADRELPRPVAGFRIPYFTAQGKDSGFYRVRYLEDNRTAMERAVNAKPVRYVQAPKSVNEVYMPPIGVGAEWAMHLRNVDQPLIITEGELKAAAACKAGLVCAGLGGVWMFMRNDKLLEWFVTTQWKEREVYIVFDSDAATNINVNKAEQRLCQAIGERGGIPYVVRLRADKQGAKVGLDDYLVKHGPKPFIALLEETEPYEAVEALHEFNSRVLVVKHPTIILERATKNKMNYNSFTQVVYASSKHVEENPTKDGGVTKKTVQTAPAWIKWPGRAECEGITYAPGKPEITDGLYNTWAGFKVQPSEKPRRRLPWNQLVGHLFANALPEHIRWFEQWCAYPLQNPGDKMNTAVVVYGITMGTGKSFLGYSLMEIYGANSAEIDEQALHNDRNEWAQNKQFILANEITGGDKRGFAYRLNNMITQRFVHVDPKYIPSYDIPDCINYYFTSNEPDAFFLKNEDRRFFVHEAAVDPLPDAFYKAYEHWLYRQGGASELFAYLLSLDLTGFNPKAAAPMTPSKEEMIHNGRSNLADWVNTLRNDPDQLLFNFPNKDIFTNSELLMMYDPTGVHKITGIGLGKELKRARIPMMNEGRAYPTSSGSQRLFIVRNFDHWRKKRNAELVKHYEGSTKLRSKKYAKAKDQD